MSATRLEGFTRCLIRFLPFAVLGYLVRFSVFHLPTTLLEMYLGVLIVSFTLTRGWNGWRDGWKCLGVWHWLILAWFGASLISLFVAPNHFAAFGLWRAYVLEPLLVLLIAADVVREKQDVDHLRRSLFAVTHILALWAVIQFVTGKGIPSPWNVSISAGRRATGPFPFPNALSLFLAPIGALAFVTWLQQPREWKFALAWISSLIGIALAKSDGGFIAFAVVALLALVSLKKTRWFTLAGVALLALIVTFVPALRHEVWQTITFQKWSGQVRLYIWRETWQMLKDHWFWGAGFGAYPTVFAAYHHVKGIEIFQYPHNILFNFWSETGLSGVAAFGAILFGWMIVAWKKGKGMLERVLLASPAIAVLIHGLVDVPYFKNDLAIVFWLLWLVTVGYAEKQRGG